MWWKVFAPTAVAALSATLFVTPVYAVVEISAKPTLNMTCSAGMCSPTANKAVLNVNDLAGMLASGDVKVTSGALAKDIELDAALNWTSSQRLTLDSYRAITFNRPVVVAGTGALTITTNDGGAHGDFQFIGKGHVELWDSTSNLVINGNSYVLIESLKQLRKMTTKGQGNTFLALAKNLNLRRFNFTKPPISGVGAVLEGLGNEIQNLTIVDFLDQDVGFFGQMETGGSQATIRDIGITNANVKGTGFSQLVGALGGYCDEGCNIIHVQVSGQVSVTGAQSRVGGLLGGSNALLTDCYSNASVTAGDGAQAVGGLVGQNDGELGGLIEQSYATGSVSGGDQVMSGGLVGYNSGGAISNSYAIGAVSTGIDGFAGGLVGANTVVDQATPKIMTSYSTGAVSGGSGALVGGFIGEDLVQTGTKSAYWDLDTSGITDPSQGAGNVPNDPNTVGLTDAQLKSGLPSGFKKIFWNSNPAINNGYPYLTDNAPPK